MESDLQYNIIIFYVKYRHFRKNDTRMCATDTTKTATTIESTTNFETL